MNTELRNKVLSTAIGEIGVVESPSGSNCVKYNTWIYGKEVRDGFNIKGEVDKNARYPWCGAFVSWNFDKNGATIKKAGLLKGFVGCPYAINHIKDWGVIVSKGQPGDIVFFDWNHDGKWDHTGIFEKDNGDGKTFTSIEGNTAHGDDSNGGKVMRRDDRKYTQAIFVRPNIYKD